MDYWKKYERVKIFSFLYRKSQARFLTCDSGTYFFSLTASYALENYFSAEFFLDTLELNVQNIYFVKKPKKKE